MIPSSAFFLYIIVMSITPGPNNLLLASSGVNFGIRRTIPMSIGVSIGNGIQCFLALQSVNLLLTYADTLRQPIGVIGCLYLLYLSWKLLHAQSPDANSNARPFGFWQMVFFQWVNPKAWLMSINVAVLFGLTNINLEYSLFLTLLYTLTNYPCVSVWALLGYKLRVVLQQPTHLRLFNLLMCLSLVFTALHLLWQELPR